MKVIKQEKKWEPITLVLETEAEYYWLLACVNMSRGEAAKSADNLGIPFTEESEACQMEVIDSIYGAYHGEMNK